MTKILTKKEERELQGNDPEKLSDEPALIFAGRGLICGKLPGFDPSVAFTVTAEAGGGTFAQVDFDPDGDMAAMSQILGDEPVLVDVDELREWSLVFARAAAQIEQYRKDR